MKITKEIKQCLPCDCGI